jgi:hypothetical protein
LLGWRAVALDPSIKAVTGNAESFGDFREGMLSRGILLERFDLEFFCVTLLLAQNTSRYASV